MQPCPFSSTYVTSRWVATSRYRPVTQPHDRVVKASNRTRLIIGLSAPAGVMSNPRTVEVLPKCKECPEKIRRAYSDRSDFRKSLNHPHQRVGSALRGILSDRRE